MDEAIDESSLLFNIKLGAYAFCAFLYNRFALL
jgi:hypothetical protein